MDILHQYPRDVANVQAIFRFLLCTRLEICGRRMTKDTFWVRHHQWSGVSRGSGPEIETSDNPKGRYQNYMADEEELSSQDCTASSKSSWKYVGTHCRVRRKLSFMSLKVWQPPSSITHNRSQNWWYSHMATVPNERLPWRSTNSRAWSSLILDEVSALSPIPV